MKAIMENGTGLREHNFYVATAKYIFYHPEYGIVSVRDPIRIECAIEHGLTPLILYGIKVPGLPLYWNTISTFGKLKPFMEVLYDAWSSPECLRGIPDVLRVSKSMHEAAPGLAGKLKEMGVKLEIASSSDRMYSASLRGAQDLVMWARRHIGKVNPDTFYAGGVEEEVANFSISPTLSTQNDDVLLSTKLNNVALRSACASWLRQPNRLTDKGKRFAKDWMPGDWLSH